MEWAQKANRLCKIAPLAACACYLGWYPIRAWADPLVLSAQPISQSSSGILGDDDSSNCAISDNARFVVFDSVASNLVSGTPAGYRQVYLRDRKNATLSLLSRAAGASGSIGNSDSILPAIAPAASLVAFESVASNLVTGDTNAQRDIFVRDSITNAISRASVSTSGAQSNGSSQFASISDSGRYVSFLSNATNLVSGDTAGYFDVFVKDRQTQETKRVSRGLASAEANGNSSFGMPAISGDGRFIVFGSIGSNIVAGDSNGRSDVFLFDMNSSTTELISQPPPTQTFDSTDSLLAMGHSSISRDGRYVVFGRDTDGDGFAELLYLRDRVVGQTELLTKSPTGVPADLGSIKPSVSADGARVSFYSGATNLLPTAVGGGIFLLLRSTNTLMLLHGADGYAPCMGEDGSAIAFQQWNATAFYDEIYLHELDDCPADSSKLQPGACGCGIPDTDSNGNGIADCKETLAPAAPLRPRLL